MARGEFTPEEMDELRGSPYVVFVDERQVFFSQQFKEHFLECYAAGEGPTAIFRAAGIDPKILGDKRIERSTARWKQTYQEGIPAPRSRTPGETAALYEALIAEKNRRIRELEALLAESNAK